MDGGLRRFAWMTVAIGTAALAAPSQTPSSACPLPELLKNLARDDGATGKQTFLTPAKVGSAAWVYWVEKRALLLVGEPAPDQAASICQRPQVVVSRQLDLKTDVVDTPEQVGSSTYLVTRSWAADTIFKLANEGKVVAVEPKKR